MALKDAPKADLVEGRVIGPNEVIRRLSKRALLALRGDAFVVMRRFDVEPGGMRDLQLHAEMLTKLSHPNVARVFGCDDTPDGVFWVTELVAGATLGDLRAACKKAGKSLPLGLAFAAIHEAALALGELHDRKRSHGDVRDANIIVGFGGHARVLEPGVLDSIQRLPPDPRADVFALANLLYECLTGTLPAGPAFALPSSCNHALEKPVDDLLLRAIGPDRSKRFKTGGEFAQALKSAAGAYMWKLARRSELVTGLFKEKRAELAELVSTAAPRLAELRAKRAAQAAAAQVDAQRAAFIAQTEHDSAQAPQMVQSEQIEDDEDDDWASRPAMPPPLPHSMPRRAVMGGMGAFIGIAACVMLVTFLSGESVAAPKAAALAPPIAVMVPVKPAEPAPPPEAAPPAEKAELATADESPSAPEAAPKPKKARKKKPARSSDDDAPLPPWLAKD